MLWFSEPLEFAELNAKSKSVGTLIAIPYVSTKLKGIYFTYNVYERIGSRLS